MRLENNLVEGKFLSVNAKRWLNNRDSQYSEREGERGEREAAKMIHDWEGVKGVRDIRRGWRTKQTSEKSWYPWNFHIDIEWQFFNIKFFPTFWLLFTPTTRRRPQRRTSTTGNAGSDREWEGKGKQEDGRAGWRLIFVSRWIWWTPVCRIRGDNLLENYEKVYPLPHVYYQA